MATFTITTPSAQDGRIVKVFGEILNTKNADGTPRDATGAEVKQAILDWLKQSVFEREQYDAKVVAAATVTPITPS